MRLLSYQSIISCQGHAVKKRVQKNDTKVVSLDTVRKKKGGGGPIRALLLDSRQAAHAIERKTCMLCHARKLCVNKTGLCASCYSTLGPKEKQTADHEAQHKIITVTVRDDRWNSEKGS